MTLTVSIAVPYCVTHPRLTQSAVPQPLGRRLETDRGEGLRTQQCAVLADSPLDRGERHVHAVLPEQLVPDDLGVATVLEEARPQPVLVAVEPRVPLPASRCRTAASRPAPRSA